jgi:hypothetical protein
LSVDNIEFLDSKKAIVVTVATSRGAKTAEAAAAATAKK